MSHLTFLIAQASQALTVALLFFFGGSLGLSSWELWEVWDVCELWELWEVWESVWAKGYAGPDPGTDPETELGPLGGPGVGEMEGAWLAYPLEPLGPFGRALGPFGGVFPRPMDP